ncbi:ead/Ea22-like family protein [Enterobacter hormaechei]|nr:ead/Ea22-like family protein [Enterobacter hormaechei]
MSNIEKQALREAADKATKGQWAVEFDDEIYSTDGVNHEQIAMVFSENEASDSAFISAANPASVLALLDELEAKDNRINRLEAIVAVAEQRNALMREWKRALKVPCDLVDDQVPVVIHGMVIRLERLKETEDKLTAAEKRIAEMQALARGVKQFSEFQVCHYGATEDYAKGYIDCQNNYNKVLFAAADKGE